MAIFEVFVTNLPFALTYLLFYLFTYSQESRLGKKSIRAYILITFVIKVSISKGRKRQQPKHRKTMPVTLVNPYILLLGFLQVGLHKPCSSRSLSASLFCQVGMAAQIRKCTAHGAPTIPLSSLFQGLTILTGNNFVFAERRRGTFYKGI